MRPFVAGAPTRYGFASYALAGGTGPLPAEVDLKRFDGPVRDQGQVGVCWAHAISGVVDNGARQQGHRDAAVSALHVVAKDSFRDLYTDVPSDPLAMEAQWPYEPPKACAFNSHRSERWCEQKYGVRPNSWRSDPQLVSELNRADSLHVLRFDQVEKLNAKPGDAHQIAGVLASGRAIWADIALDRDAWNWNQVADGRIDDYQASRSGGHAVVIVGYRNEGGERLFQLKNSWGPRWGQGGYAWISGRALAKNLRQAFVLRVLSSRGTAPPSPVPSTHPQTWPLPLPQVATLPWPQGLPVPWGTPASAPEPRGSGGAQLPSPCVLMPALPMCPRR